MLCGGLDGWGGVGWEGGLRGMGYMYTYRWFTVLDSRNQHNYTPFKKINPYGNCKPKNYIR